MVWFILSEHAENYRKIERIFRTYLPQLDQVCRQVGVSDWRLIPQSDIGGGKEARPLGPRVCDSLPMHEHDWDYWDYWDRESVTRCRCRSLKIQLMRSIHVFS
ncbi:MAG: hypothetical protein RL346_1691 [Verrucomicrobiota bacterium]